MVGSTKGLSETNGNNSYENDEHMNVYSITKKEKINKITKKYMIGNEEDYIKEIMHSDKEYKPLSDAIDGFGRVLSSLRLPFIIMSSFQQQRRFDSFHAASRIRNLANIELGAQAYEDSERKAHRIASKNMADWMSSSEGVQSLKNATIDALFEALQFPPIELAASELLMHGMISTWSVLEVFLRDCFIDLVNKNPFLAREMANDARLKSIFGKLNVDVSTLEHYNFDIKSSMGNIIFNEKRFESITAIKAIYDIVFADSFIREHLETKIKPINQIRHLIVHRRGIIDKEFKSKNGHSGEVGQKLTLCSNDVEDALIASSGLISKIMFHVTN